MDTNWSEDRQKLIEIAARYHRLADAGVVGANDVAYLCERAGRQIARCVEDVAAANQAGANGADHGR